MVRVTIEMVPSGDESRKYHIGTVEIINDLSGNVELGNYTVRLSKFDDPKKTWKRGKITGFPRLKRGPFDLLYLALHSLISKRNKTS